MKTTKEILDKIIKKIEENMKKGYEIRSALDVVKGERLELEMDKEED